MQVTDSLAEAEEFANATWAKSKEAEKAAFDKARFSLSLTLCSSRTFHVLCKRLELTLMLSNPYYCQLEVLTNPYLLPMIARRLRRRRRRLRRRLQRLLPQRRRRMHPLLMTRQVTVLCASSLSLSWLQLPWKNHSSQPNQVNPGRDGLSAHSVYRSALFSISVLLLCLCLGSIGQQPIWLATEPKQSVTVEGAFAG